MFKESRIGLNRSEISIPACTIPSKASQEICRVELLTHMPKAAVILPEQAAAAAAASS